MTLDILYSHTEGSTIAAKIRQEFEDEAVIRMGISFALDKAHKSTVFKPEQEYCNASAVGYLLDLSNLIEDSEEKRRFCVKRADLCYGGSVGFINTDSRAGEEIIYMTREPIGNGNCSLPYLSELKRLCDSLVTKYKNVALCRESGSYLSAAADYNPLTEKPGVNIDLLDIQIPKEVLGCRIEFVLPEGIYDYKKIETPFNAVAQHVKFGKMLEELENDHREFLQMADSSRESKKLKVVKKVSV